jgi:hypothetical protein
MNRNEYTFMGTGAHMMSDQAASDPEIALQQIGDASLTRQEVEEILAAFGSRNGLPPLVFDEDGTIELSIADEVEMVLLHVPSFPGVMAGAALPEGLGERGDLTRELLRANLSWAETAGATFVRFPGGGPYALCRLISLAGRDDRAFERELLAFAGQARDWIDEIELGLDLPRTDADAGPAPRAGTPLSYA